MKHDYIDRKITEAKKLELRTYKPVSLNPDSMTLSPMSELKQKENYQK